MSKIEALMIEAIRVAKEIYEADPSALDTLDYMTMTVIAIAVEESIKLRSGMKSASKLVN